MPVSIKNNKKSAGSHKTFRTTDRCVQAEMKNKMETIRLNLQSRMLSKQQLHSSFMLEKDKRLALSALGQMRKTSGLSLHSMAPEDPSDRAHEDSQYFKCYRPISEKRLVQWRAREKEMDRQLAMEEDLLVPLWEKDPEDSDSKRFGKVMRRVGYEVTTEDIEQAVQINSLAKEEPEKPLLQLRRIPEPVDVFECLREPSNETKMVYKDGKLLVEDDSFSAAAWERKSALDYSKMVQNPQTGKRYRRVQSAMPRMQGSSSENGNLIKVNSEDSSQKQMTVRPQTASARLNRKPSATPSYESPGRPSDRTFRRNFSQGSLASLCETTETEENEHDNNNDVDTGQSLLNGITSNATTDESLPGNRNNDSSSTQGGGSLSKQKKLSKRDSLFIMTSVLNTEPIRESKVTFKDVDEDKTDAEPADSDTPRRRSRISSVNDLVKMRRSSRKMSEIDIDHFGESVPKIMDIHHEEVDSLFKKMPKTRTKQKSAVLAKTERKITIHEEHRKLAVTAMDPLAALDNASDEDEESDDLTSFQRMPQWKRDLMAEAPPGLFGPKSAVKVAVAISKAQRRRELDKLVTDNLTDVRKLTDGEHARRIRARLHLFLTMKKLGEAADVATKESGDNQKTH